MKASSVIIRILILALICSCSVSDPAPKLGSLTIKLEEHAQFKALMKNATLDSVEYWLEAGGETVEHKAMARPDGQLVINVEDLEPGSDYAFRIYGKENAKIVCQCNRSNIVIEKDENTTVTLTWQAFTATLSQPGESADIFTKRPTFQWEAVPTATQYAIEVSSDMNFGSTIISENTSAATYTAGNDLSLGKWYWRVKAKDANEQWGDWSAVWDFTIQSVTLAVTPDSLVLGADANLSGNIDVSSNTTWSATESADWLSLSATSGSGDGSFTVTATVNSGFVSRSAEVTVTADEGGSETIVVTQQPSVTLSVSPDTLALGADSNLSDVINVSSNASWTVSESADWLTLSAEAGSGDGSVTVTADANTNPATRSAEVTVTADGVVTETVIVTQEAYIELTLSGSTLSLDASTGASNSFDIITNTSWTATESADWLTLSLESGSGNSSITVTADTNSALDPRTATVTVTAGGTVTETILVTQAGRPTASLSLNVTDVNLDFVSGATGTFTITSNANWTVTASSSWFTVSSTQGNGDATITVTATLDNDGVVERTQYIVISAPGLISQSITVTQTYAHCVGNDGKIYRVVKIGDQWWLAENLRETKFQNGDVIPRVEDDDVWEDGTTGMLVPFDNDDDLVDTYGYLYNGYAVATIAPEGWRVPTDDDWKIMERYLGMSEEDSNADGNYRGSDEALKLMASSIYWASNTSHYNSTGFSAIGSGYKEPSGRFMRLREMAWFWTSTRGTWSFHLLNRMMQHDWPAVMRWVDVTKNFGMSIRLIKE